jgi:hypothetical protein
VRGAIGEDDGDANGDAMPEGSVVGGCCCRTMLSLMPVEVAIGDGEGVIDWLAGPFVEGLAPAAMAVAITATPMVVANIPCLMGKVYRSSRYAKHEASER